MAVILLPDRVAGNDPKGLHAKWGMIEERIAGDEELVAAIRDVLLCEHYKESSAPDRSKRPDEAYADACFGDGWQQGIAAAADALTDRKYIREQRIRIEEQTRKEPATDE